MANVSAAVSDWRVIFYGQSLIASDGPTTIVGYTMAGRGTPYRTQGIPGYAWLQLDALAPGRLHPYANVAPNTILIMVGGTTDYIFGQTGLQCYGHQRDLAVNAKLAGFDYVIATTTTPSTGFGVSTTVDVLSNNVNTNTFAGAGILNVASTTNAISPGTLKVATAGTTATITYTGTTSTTFTGCNTTSGGGVMSTGGYVRNNAYQNFIDGNVLVMANIDLAFDYVVDLATDPNLDEPNDPAWYSDGTHPTQAGRQHAASLLAVPLNAILP